MEMYKKTFLLAADVIKKAKNILLIPHAKMDCDGMSSAIALHDILTQMGKNPTAVCPDPVPESFTFLPNTDLFQTEIPENSGNLHQTIVTLDASEKNFADLKYEVKDGKVNIIISSENSPFEEADFSFLQNSFQPDLIICLDSGDVKQLGKIYEDNTELFASVPVLNIDHHISNTQFGTVNLVEMKNSSTTEIIYDLIPYMDDRGHTMISEDVATLLLAGLITDTGSFQHSNTTPKSLDTAAALIDLGARQQEIIKHLFKTKSLATLRLWGKVLTQLQNDPMYRIVWSSISAEDLQETMSHSDEAEGLIDELLSTTPGTEMVFLVKEREDGLITTSIRTSSSLVDATVFADKFGGGGHRQAAGFKIRERGGKSFDEIVADIIFEAKNFQSERLQLAPPVANISQIANIATLDQPETAEMIPEETPVEEVRNEQDLFPDFTLEKPEISPEENIENIEIIESVESTKNTEEKQEDVFPEISAPEPVIDSVADILEAQVDIPVETVSPEISQKTSEASEVQESSNLFPENSVEMIPEELEQSFVSEPVDEFAMFLETAKEKEEDEKFDTTFQNTNPVENTTSIEIPEISAPFDFVAESVDSDPFGPEVLEELQKENPHLSPIPEPNPEIFEVEKPSEAVLMPEEDDLPDWLLDAPEEVVVPEISQNNPVENDPVFEISPLQTEPLQEESEKVFAEVEKEIPETSEILEKTDTSWEEKLPDWMLADPEPVAETLQESIPEEKPLPVQEEESDFLNFLNQENPDSVQK